jgi:hypothetical protein
MLEELAYQFHELEVEEEKYFADGSVPLDGSNPLQYSSETPLNKYSILYCGEPVNKDTHAFLPAAPPPTYFTQEELYLEQLAKTDDFSWDWQYLEKDGTFKLICEKTKGKMKGVVSLLAKKAIKGVFSKKKVASSFPVKIFGGLTQEQYMAHMWRLCPYFLNKAAETTDKLERMKLLMTNQIASTYLGFIKAKPFIPHLGETLQAKFQDGTEIYLEQTSKGDMYEAGSNMLIVGGNKNYTISGYYALKEKQTGGNSSKIILLHDLLITFKDGHKIEFHPSPNLQLKNIMKGDYGMYTVDNIYAVDLSTGTKAFVFYDYGQKKGFFSKKTQISADKVQGIIYTPDTAAKPLKKKPKRVSDLNDVKEKLADISGSWIENVVIDSVEYWDFRKFRPLKLVYTHKPLPSDWRFREDLIYNIRSMFDYGDDWKDTMILRLSADNKERKKFRPKGEKKQGKIEKQLKQEEDQEQAEEKKDEKDPDVEEKKA